MFGVALMLSAIAPCGNEIAMEMNDNLERRAANNSLWTGILAVLVQLAFWFVVMAVIALALRFATGGTWQSAPPFGSAHLDTLEVPAQQSAELRA